MLALGFSRVEYIQGENALLIRCRWSSSQGAAPHYCVSRSLKRPRESHRVDEGQTCLNAMFNAEVLFFPR